MQSAVQERRDAIARRHPRWDEMTLEAYLDRAAMDFGDRPLLLTDAVTLSYAQVVEGTGSHEGHHHFISLGLVADIEDGKVRLSANADVAIGFEEPVPE